MIETCTRKRMALAIFLLLSVTVVTLIVEGMWSNNHKLAELNEKKENESQCGNDDIKVVQECHPCMGYDMASMSPPCVKTGYKEGVKCKGGPTIERSCKMDPWVAEKKFWILQVVTCIVGLGSYGVVKYRQKMLDKTLTEKVNRQIAA